MTQATVPQTAWETAQQYLAHGVNSPVRAFGAVGGEPVFLRQGRGAVVTDTQGRHYVDYVGGWGPLILGHTPAPVVKAIQRQASQASTLGLPTELETTLARSICEAFPSIERVRLTCSGTEACMSAIRVARAATGRTKIITFAGGYHGHADPFLVHAGSGVVTFAGGGVPSSAGVTAAVANDTLVAEYNHLGSVRALMAMHANDVAAVIVEPCAANMGVIPPQPGFLTGLRELTEHAGVMLIFDEVVTGFRVRYGGMQHVEHVQPDLTILGKIIGGGLPIGAFGGRADLMEQLAPAGAVYQAGTLAGHPLAMAAGIATLELLRTQRPYTALAERTRELAVGIEHAAQSAHEPLTVISYTSLLCCFFTEGIVTHFAQAQRANVERYAQFFHGMLQEGILLPPSQFEAWFVSGAHSAAQIQQTVTAAQRVLAQLDKP